jgi:hypothetical protein
MDQEEEEQKKVREELDSHEDTPEQIAQSAHHLIQLFLERNVAESYPESGIIVYALLKEMSS